MADISFADLLGAFSLPALGIAIDRLLVRRHKIVVHDWLVASWLQLEAATFPNVSRRLAARVLAAITPVFSRIGWVKLIGALVFLSWLFTSSAGALGTFMDGRADPNPYTWLPIFPVYFVNAPSDSATILVFWLMVRAMARRGAFAIFGLVLLNLAASLLIAIITLPALYWSSDVAFIHNWPGSGDGIYAITYAEDAGLQTVMWPMEEAGLREVDSQGGGTLVKNNWTLDDPASGAKLHAERFKMTSVGRPLNDAQIRALRHLREVPYWKIRESDFSASNNQTLAQYYPSVLTGLFSNFQNWAPRADISVEAHDNTFHVSVEHLTFNLDGRWPLLLVAATSFVPIACFCALLGFFAALKVCRDLFATCLKYIFERSADPDPRVAPERFIPFTLCFSALGIVLAIGRLCILWALRIH